MKKSLLIAVLAILALAAQAGDKNSVLVPMQFTQAQRGIIPEKTDYLKLQNLAFNTRGEQKQLIAALKPVLDSIVTTNYESPFFSLSINPMVDGGTRIAIASYDVMSESQAARKLLYGVIKVKYCYFIVKHEVATADNILVLQQALNNAGGKIKFERVYELVTEPVHYRGTKFVGLYKSGKLTPSTFVVNGDDLLHPAPAEPLEEPAAAADTTSNN